MKPKKGYGDNTLENYYSKTDLAKFHLFQDDYINWRYWKGIDVGDSATIDIQARIRSSAQLYQLVFDKLNVSREDDVLEVGCGKGLGCVQLVQARHPRAVAGVDLFDAQIKRSKLLHADFLQQHPEVQFKTGKAEALPFDDNVFSRIYSVEAAQHFRSISEFLKETYRVLKRNGRLCVTTYFGKTAAAHDQLSPNVSCIAEGADRAWPIEEVLAIAGDVGFQDIHCESIGRDVFKGWDKWMAQMGYDDAFWGRHWLKAHQQGLVDYYVITARK